MQSHAKIVSSLTDPPLGPIRDGDNNCRRREGVASPKRAGTSAVRFELNACQQRAEIGIPGNPNLDESTWYGWSTMLDPNWKKSASFDIIMQWHGDTNSLPCGGGGYHMTVIGDRLVLTQTYRSEGKIKCQRIPLLEDYSPMIGKWTDFVMEINFTEKTNGYVRFWIQIDGKGYKQVFDYKGPTWFEKEAPYTQFGIYKGDPNQNSPYPRIVYTDEVRRGDATSSFEEVAPDGKGGPPNNSQKIQIPLTAEWNLISTPIDPKDNRLEVALSSLAGKYLVLYAYDAATGQYQRYIPGNTDNGINTLDSGRGYWLYMNQSSTLNIEGTTSTKPIALIKGWNLVGYNRTNSMPVAGAIGPIKDKITAVYSYTNGSYKGYVPNSGGDLTEFKPGYGYWILATENTSWTLP
jgi:hypothetical protein